MKTKWAFVLPAALIVLIGFSREGMCGSKLRGAKIILDVIMSEYEERQRVSVDETKDIVLYRKTIDYDDFHKMVVLEKSDVLMEYGGNTMNYIVLQTTNNLLEDKYYLFEEGINDRYEAGALYTVSSHVGAINMKNLTVETELIKDDGEFEGSYLSIDVDPSGRYVLLPYIGEDPDFPYIRIYDGKERVFHEIDAEELIEYRMENVRWRDSINTIEFLNPDTGQIVHLSVDWEEMKIVKVETLK